MIALDTNVLVRYIMQDDPAQAERANSLIDSMSSDGPALVPLVVVVELVWVLVRSYKLDREHIVQALEALLASRELVIQNAAIVWAALRIYRRGRGDFSDCLIARCAQSEGCQQIMTFDRSAAKHAGMKLVP